MFLSRRCAVRQCLRLAACQGLHSLVRWAGGLGRTWATDPCWTHLKVISIPSVCCQAPRVPKPAVIGAGSREGSHGSVAGSSAWRSAVRCQPTHLRTVYGCVPLLSHQGSLNAYFFAMRRATTFAMPNFCRDDSRRSCSCVSARRGFPRASLQCCCGLSPGSSRDRGCIYKCIAAGGQLGVNIGLS